MAEEYEGLPAPTVHDLTITAIRLVDAIMEYRQPREGRISTVPRREPEASKFGLEIMTGAQLINTPAEILHERDIVSDPVVWSLKRTLKDVGQMLYDRVGSTEKLLEIADQIANRDPENFGRRMSPIDSAWNGVGNGDDRWHS